MRKALGILFIALPFIGMIAYMCQLDCFGAIVAIVSAFGMAASIIIGFALIAK